jgi:hypothetical protein
MMTLRFAPLLLAAAFPCHAADFPSIGSLSQDEFHRLSQDLGAAFSYKGVTPATPLGLTGFDVGVEVTDTRIENSRVFALAGAGNTSNIVVPKVHVYKGLFGGLDVGAFVAGASQVNASLVGVDLRLALMDDGVARPALGVRLSGTRAGGLGDLSFGTAALDLMISKKFTAFTPYAGVGTVRVQSKIAGSTLAPEKFNASRAFGGLNVNLVAVNLAFEAEKMGANTSLSAKIGWRF